MENSCEVDLNRLNQPGLFKITFFEPNLYLILKANAAQNQNNPFFKNEAPGFVRLDSINQELIVKKDDGTPIEKILLKLEYPSFEEFRHLSEYGWLFAKGIATPKIIARERIAGSIILTGSQDGQKPN